MAIIDISPVLRRGMPSWPGDTPFAVERTMSIGSDGPVNVSQIVLSSHAGAHVDAPLHFVAHGRAINEIALELFIGLCTVVDARRAGACITEADVLPQLPARCERVLIRQYGWAPTAWDPNLKGLDPQMIPGLAARGCRLIGVDAASVDPAISKTLDAHRAIEALGMAIVEGLVLDDVSPGQYELIALPLKIEGCDAAPVRAVLRTIDRGTSWA